MKHITTKLFAFIFLAILFTGNSIFAQTLTIAPDLAMDESNLDARVVTLTLTSETFADATLDQANFTLNNVPAGTTIESVTYTDPTHADLALAFDGTDFDVDYTTFNISIAGVELTGGSLLTSNDLTITAILEIISLTITPDMAMDEANLDARVLTLTLTNETFADATLDQMNFALNNVPAGTTIESVTYTDPTHAELALAFNGTDFDSDSTNVSVFIAGIELTGGVSQVSDSVTITAILEIASMTITPDIAMDEANLDARVLFLTLNNETFADAALDPFSFTLNNPPVGTFFESITFTSPTTATIALAFNGTDFDYDSTNVTVSVLGLELTGGNPLTSNSVTVTAIKEPAVLTITPDAPMIESTLDLRTLTLTLANDTFVDASLNQANFTLNNVPAGTTIESITYTNPLSAELAIAFDGTDFDMDSTNVSVTIAGAELTFAADVTSDSITITAIDEVPTLTILADSTLLESTLNYRTISMSLSYDTYADNLFNNANFTLNNAPAGLTVDTLIYNSINNITMGLAFDGTDFDLDSTHFSITIAGAELTGAADLTSNELTVVAEIEIPAITITEDMTLTEDNLDSRYINVMVAFDQFVDDTLDQANFTLNNVPPGTTIESIVWTDSINAVVNLAFDGTDFDVDYTMFSITIAGAEFDGATDLTSNELTIIANPEASMLTITEDTTLYETTLDDRMLTLALTYDHFTDNMLDTANFTFNNAPMGVMIDSVVYIDSITATLYIGFDDTDFDFDSTNVTLSILGAELYSSGDVTSNAVTIYAFYEELFIGLNEVDSYFGLTMPTDVTTEIGNAVDIDIELNFPDSFSVYIPVDYLFDVKLDMGYTMALDDSLIISYEGMEVDTFVAVGGETEMWLSDILATPRSILINNTDATWAISIRGLLEGQYNVKSIAYTALYSDFDDEIKRVKIGSDSTLVTIYELISMNIQPMDDTVCTNYSSTFTTSVVSNVPVSYQWQFNGIDIVDASDPTYGKDSTLVISSTQLADAGDYSCYIFNDYFNVTSDVATLTVDVSPNIDIVDELYMVTGQVMVMGVTAGYDSYEWSTGATIRMIVLEANLLTEGYHNIWISVEDFSNNCVTNDTTLLYVNHSINVDDVEGYSFNIYPNPATDILNIDYVGIDNSEMNVEIIDIAGKVVYKNKYEMLSGKLNKSINLTDLNNGVYIIKATIGDKQFIDKLIIE